MEENANVVVKLLIRRPECFGPALRGEGGQGLLVAMKEAIKISEDPTLDLPKIIEGVSAGYESPRSLYCTVLWVLNIQHLSILIPPFSLLSCLIFFFFLRKKELVLPNCQMKISTQCVAVLARKEEKLYTWAMPSCLSTQL